MEKTFFLSVILFAWRVCAQTTDTTIETEVPGGNEIQTGENSTPLSSSDVPETTPTLSEPEATEPPSNEDSEAGEESVTESQQETSTQSTNEETTIQQGNEITESGIEMEDAISGTTNEQGLESDAEERATTAQPPAENPVMPQEDTTPQPTVQEDITSQPVAQEDTTQQPVAQEDTTPQPVAQEDTTPQPVAQEDTTPQPVIQEDSTPQPAVQEDTTPPPVLQETTPEITTQREETETERTQDQENAVPEITTIQEISTSTQQRPVVTEMATISPSPVAEEQENPTESSEGQSTESVRSAVEGDVATVMVETEDSAIDSTSGVEATKADGPNADPDNIAKDESACPTYCATGTGDPICGTDQRVYENECHLRKDTCGKNITVASWELCRGKHDICPAQCLNIQDPVCGEDGKIYPNLCLMFKFNCGKRMRTYDLVRCVNSFRGFRRVDGACPKVCHELYRPVCGSDGKVYSNDCYLRLQTCGRNVKIVEMSQCVDTPRCPHTCTPLYDPVCGSDGRMYLNHCYFANLNCGKSVAKVDIRYCKSFQHL